MTALEWLCSKLPTIDNNDPYYRDIFEQAKQMEKEQTEISDDDIEDVAWEKFITDSGRFGFISGAKWYREQLKNK